MKIIQLTAENVKRLRVVSIKPDGDFVEIAGENGHGKSCVLDCIWWALAGKKNIQAVPIHEGCEEAMIRLNLGDIRVVRTFTDKGTTTLTVRDAKGKPPDTPDKKLPKVTYRPQEMLDKMLGELTFDPLKFAQMDARDQFDELRRISKLSVDIDALDEANKEDYKARTDINRDARELHAQAEGIHLPEGLPAKPADEDALLNEIQSAAQHNAEIETRKVRREQTEAEMDRLRQSAERHEQDVKACVDDTAAGVKLLEAQIAQLNAKAKTTIKDLRAGAGKSLREADALEKKLKDAPPLPEPVSVDGLREKLDAAKETNEHIRRREERDEKLEEAASLKKKSVALTKKMEAREKEKDDAIKAAEMPVEGLGFGDGYVTFKGLPFDQGSDAEQLRVSVSIAMSANPDIRIIRVRQGSLLDKKGLALLAKMAKDNDYQIWCERVDPSSKAAIVMVDGEVGEVKADE